MKLTDYLSQFRSWQDVSFTIQGPEGPRQSPIRSAHDWLAMEEFCSRYEVINADKAPLVSAPIFWHRWYMMGRLKCAIIREVDSRE